MRNAAPHDHEATMEPLDKAVNHVRGSEGVVHRGGYDAAGLLEALAG